MELLPLVSRWAHVISVILLVGGTLFMRFALVPASADQNISDEAREAIRSRWAKCVGAAILFLLVSGLYNATLKALAFKMSGVYLTLLALKFVLGFVVFFIISVLNGRSDRAIQWREKEKSWLNIACVLMLALVMMAGYMKMTPQQPKHVDVKPSASIEQVETNN